MILFYTGLLMPLTVFLYTGFVRTLPRDYEEAAQVDGATQWRTFTRVVLPLLLPVTGTVAVLDALFVWNDFFTQLIFLSGTHNETVPGRRLPARQHERRAVERDLRRGRDRARADPRLLPVRPTTMIRGFSGGVRG